MKMRTGKWTALVSVLAIVGVLSSSLARADVASDRAGALLVFPKILFSSLHLVGEEDAGQTGGVLELDARTDTIVQISNVSTEPVRLHCFYIEASSICSLSGFVCDPTAELPCPEERDVCMPNWVETDFRVFLTPRQPIAWTASGGLTREDLPLDGTFRTGIGGSSNAGTLVPPVPARETAAVAIVEKIIEEQGRPVPETFDNLDINAYFGELKCIVVDAEGRGIARNVIKGEATISTILSFAFEGDAPLVTGGGSTEVSQAQMMPVVVQVPNVEKYSAIGIQAIEGDVNGDRVLELGGEANEYNGCPNVLIVDHFFDFAEDPIGAEGHIFSDLTLVPCSQNLRTQQGGRTPVQYLVFNEFEQRFSTSKPVVCFFESPLSRIDTRDSTRSIFSVFVAGTLTGQTRVRGVDGGLLGIVRESRGDDEGDIFGTIFPSTSPSAAFNVHQQGVRSDSDSWVLP